MLGGSQLIDVTRGTVRFSATLTERAIADGVKRAPKTLFSRPSVPLLIANPKLPPLR